MSNVLKCYEFYVVSIVDNEKIQEKKGGFVFVHSSFVHELIQSTFSLVFVFLTFLCDLLNTSSMLFYVPNIFHTHTHKT